MAIDALPYGQCPVVVNPAKCSELGGGLCTDTGVCSGESMTQNKDTPWRAGQPCICEPVQHPTCMSSSHSFRKGNLPHTTNSSNPLELEMAKCLSLEVSQQRG